MQHSELRNIPVGTFACSSTTFINHHLVHFPDPRPIHDRPSMPAEENILLHPDALHCLKRKQLISLCRRLDVKATGKVGR